MAQIVLDRLQRKFGAAVHATHGEHGNETVVVDRPRLVEVAEFLKVDRELAFDMPIDCTVVDWQGNREPRFDVVYHIYSTKRHHRLRLKALVPESDPTCPSLTSVWPGMNWHEREAWDLYGVRFVGHPNLRRILLYEEFVGHPLRKDYPIDRRQPLVSMRPVVEVPTQRNPPAELLNKP
ncbi:MAG: NADH-quinone oxidoreductase subunit C [Deltaproteobacteria bacterium]|nr:NADH-quinone oxidoreductase subunit C [Deltaproteobacteria bacterium]